MLSHTWQGAIEALEREKGLVGLHNLLMRIKKGYDSILQELMFVAPSSNSLRLEEKLKKSEERARALERKADGLREEVGTLETKLIESDLEKSKLEKLIEQI